MVPIWKYLLLLTILQYKIKINIKTLEIMKNLSLHISFILGSELFGFGPCEPMCFSGDCKL